MQRTPSRQSERSAHSRDTLLFEPGATPLSQRRTNEFQSATPLTDNTRSTGRYRLERPLGTGGTAEVHLATDRDTGEHVAVKTTLSEVGSSSKYLTRETRALSLLDHHNIVSFLDSGTCSDDDTPYLVMEHLVGRDLQETIFRYGALPWDGTKLITLQLLDALQAVHEENMVHADVKPENIFIENNGGVKLFDFGMVRFMDDENGDPDRLNDGYVLGTVSHMAPEQMVGDTCDSFDHRADIYSVGVVMYEMATGALPFDIYNRAPIQVMQDVLRNTPPAPSTIVPTIKSTVDATIMRCLEKDPERRFINARQMADVIASL